METLFDSAPASQANPRTSADLMRCTAGHELRDPCGNLWRKSRLGLWCPPVGHDGPLLSDWALSRVISDSNISLLTTLISLVFVLCVACGLVTCAHAGTTEKELASLGPLRIPGDEEPVAEVLFLSITRRPFGMPRDPEIDSLWDRLSKAELRVLCLEELVALLTDRLDAIEESGATEAAP